MGKKLELHTVRELKNICRKKKIKGYSNLKKNQLIKVITRQRGGVLIKDHKILGVGSFGWIVTPAIPCGNTKDLYNKVSKFTKKQDSINDIKVGNKLKKIDKDGKYFIYVKKNCKISTKKVEDTLEMDFTDMSEEMKAEGEGPLIFYNLIMDKGDITIQEYFRRYKISDEVGVKILIKLLMAIERLVKSGYTHTDLHNENIILKSTSKNKYEFVIIDFGDISTDSSSGEKDMLFNILSNVGRGDSPKSFRSLLKRMRKYTTIKECFDEIKKSGYDLNMDLQIEKKDTKPKKKSFFKRLL